MAWLHTSFTRHQTLGESGGNNLRKGYKVASIDNNADPDNSDTPLLYDSSSRNNQKILNPNWFENISKTSGSEAAANTSLSANLFDKSGINPKLKAEAPSGGKDTKGQKMSTENKKLLSCEKKMQFEEDEDDDSDDEWCLPSSGGYHKIRSGTD